MKIHYLQHVPFEGLGSIESWAVQKNAEITCTQLFNDEDFPSHDNFDWLIVMGGPMNIYDNETYPWLKHEKTFIKEAIDCGKTVLGICLGAQLIADVLGAKIYANQEKEIGWFPITLAKDLPNSELTAMFNEGKEVMHWHGDTFSLPDQATRLASSKACQNQGFIYQNRVIALQFHLETTKDSLSKLIANSMDEIVEAPYIQPPKIMLAHEERFTIINTIMSKLLDYLSTISG